MRKFLANTFNCALNLYLWINMYLSPSLIWPCKGIPFVAYILNHSKLDNWQQHNVDFLTYCHMFLLSSLFRSHSLHNKKYKFRHECSGVVELFHSHISVGTRKIHWILLVFFLSASSSFSYGVGDVAFGHQLWKPPLSWIHYFLRILA